MYRYLGSLLLAFAWTTSVHAETRYVTDQILVSLRPQADDQSSPLERLPTGSAVEVLKDNGAFLKVKSSTGQVGFVRAQYFVATPAKAGGETATLREQLQLEQKKTAALAAELESLRKVPAGGDAASQEALAQARSELEELSQKHQKLQQECDSLEGLTQERDRLKAENLNLKTTATGKSGGELKWFLSGGAVFFFGWLAGKMSRQKRRY